MMISISHRETMSYCSRPVDASHGFVESKTVPGDCRIIRHTLYHAGRKGPAKERDRTTSFDRIDSGGRHEGGGGPVK